MKRGEWREGDYIFEQKIGKGTFAEVYSARDSKGNKVAIKKVLYKDDKNSVIFRRREIQANLKLRYKCPKGIANLHDYYERDGNLYLVFKLITGKELFFWLKEREFKPLSENKARKLFTQMVRVVHQCHKRNIFHRDLKLDNFIITKDEKIMLIDFGLCSTDTGSSTEYVGSIDFGAPEILSQKPYLPEKVDVFSLGTILYVLIFGHMPFESMERLKFLQKKIPVHPKLEFMVPTQASIELQDLLTKMLRVEASRRIELQEVLRHKWMTNGNILFKLFQN